MIELGIIDLSAEGRRRVATLIEKWGWATPDAKLSPPRLSISLLSPEEVRFHGSLDLCVIGPELITADAAYIHTVRQQLPGKLILCIVDSATYSYGLVEQLGRLGVDDVLLDSASSEEFFRRIVLLQRRVRDREKAAVLVVSGSRGGVGTTFVTAALAEASLAKGRKTCVVDCDIRSQDLSRFFQVRPCVSEAVRLLIDQQRIVTSEVIKECACQVWKDEEKLVCIPPPAGGDEAIFASPKAARAFVHFIEGAQSVYETIIVDSARLPSTVMQSLYQIADHGILVVNRDPSGAFASRQSLAFLAGCVPVDARISTVVNDNSVVGMPLPLMRKEVLVTPGKVAREVFIPRLPRAAAWPCSGYTPYQFLSRQFDQLLSGDDIASSLRRSAWARVATGIAWAHSRVVGRSWRGRKKRRRDEDEVPQKPVTYPELEFAGSLGAEDDLVSKPVVLA